MNRLSDEHIKQIANTMGTMTHVAHDLEGQGYSIEVIAEGMMEGAFHTLKHDRKLFLSVLTRFRQSYQL